MVTQPSTLGPLGQVLAALDAGAHSLAEVSGRTGLSRDVVDASVDHLVRVGRLEARTLTTGCPDAGCGSCASGCTDGSAGCGAAGPGRPRSDPTLVTISVRP